jgi:hypothetical protein
MLLRIEARFYTLANEPMHGLEIAVRPHLARLPLLGRA